MRDKTRIKFIMLKLQYLWEQNPDLRFGQLVSNIYNKMGYSDQFYVEDSVLDEFLDSEIDKIKSEN